ncbi:class II aldolase/adducin family protein [Blautia schinkii]|nr:class II aldolase/adducin family protein [Blautia schinkii]
MTSYEAICDDIISVGKEMYQRGLIIGTDGNISVKMDDGNIVITGSGYCKGKLKRENMSLITPEGKVLAGPKPARDVRMHLAVYRTCPDINSVVHAHPPVITGFSMSHYDFEKMALPEAMFNLHGVACTDYAVPISVDVARGIMKVIREKPECRAIVMANHGALTFSEDIYDAFYKMETLEFFGKSLLVSKLIGDTYYLNFEEQSIVNRLMRGVDPDDIVPPDATGL